VVVTEVSGEAGTKHGAKGQMLKVKAGWSLLGHGDAESLWTRLLEEKFNNNSAAGSWRLDLDYAQDPAAMEDSSSDEEDAEDHLNSDYTEEEKPSCGDEEEEEGASEEDGGR
jgi:hypothetical protein